MNSKITLTLNLYLKRFSEQGVGSKHAGIKGGTIHQFLRESTVQYYGGKCPVYYVEHWIDGERCVIGGNYARKGNKPRLVFGEELDFSF